MTTAIVAPHVRDLETLARQLEAWMSGKMPDAEELQIENLAYPLGAGQSHETILFDANWTHARRRQSLGCVVRIKPTRFTVFLDDCFERQYHVMRVLHQNGHVRVAKPLWIEQDTSILGAPFFVMEKVRGRVAVSIPSYAREGWVAEASPSQRARMWENGVRTLAAIQKTPLGDIRFLEGPENARSGLPQEWNRYERTVRWLKEVRPWPLLDTVIERLLERWPKNQPAGLVWGDARIGNMMFDNEFNVAAVMDWEQPSLGGALQDLAWWLVLSRMMHCDADGRPILTGFGTREETIALWREVTGLSAEDIEWYEDFTTLKTACTSIRMNALRGSPPPELTTLIRQFKL